MTDTCFTESEFLEFLKNSVKEAGSTAAFCNKHTHRNMMFTPDYIDGVLAGGNSVGSSLVKALGFEKRTVYVKRSNGTSVE